MAHKPMKQAVIAPSMLALLYPLDSEIPGYSREQFEEDLVGECEKDIRQAFAAGAARVSVDFTEGRLATRNDARNPWTGRGMLPHFIELNNRVMARFTAEERSRIGVHTCPGGDRDSVHSADVPYSDLLPSMFGINAGYFLIQDLVGECEKDIRQAFAAGAARVSVDFTEGRLATRNDARNPWTGRGMLPHFIELNNRVMARFTAEERSRIGVHTCPGGDRDSVHSADVPYSDLLPSMFGINAGYFLIQLASERDQDPVYQLIGEIGENLRDDADGVTQMAYVGVINPLNPRVESPEEVRDALIRAASFIPKEQLGATDDCGFSPFSIDEKPNHGSPDFARETAWQKIRNRVEGTRLAADKLGVS